MKRRAAWRMVGKSCAMPKSPCSAVRSRQSSAQCSSLNRRVTRRTVGKALRNAQARNAVWRGAQSAMPGAIPKPEAPCRAAHPLKPRAMHPIPKHGAPLHPVAKPRAMPSPRLSARRLLPHPPRCSPRHDFPGRAALTPSASSTVAEKSQKPVRVPSGPGASEGE